jgi:hypothetical protein
MRLPIAFDPLEVGEVDFFAYNFAADMGNASMVSTAWTATFLPHQVATDPNPQAIILSTSVATSIDVRSPVDNSIVTLNGFFSIAKIGNMPASAQSGVYVLDAALTLSDGRILKLNSTCTCKAPGQP